jgi:predicted TIM-barrel fold metal-dependent hydrolase
MNPAPANLGTALLTRREFLHHATIATAAVATAGAPAGAAGLSVTPPVPDAIIVDIHVHCTHRGRTDDAVLVHQRNTGVTISILLPAGTTGGLAAGAAGSAHVVTLAQRHPDRFRFCANENVFRENAAREIERQLRLGAVGIGELKDAGACDSREMARVAEVAREFDVPMLIHFQDGSYNDGFARFHRILEKFPTVRFIAHAQTFWANIDAAYETKQGLRPTGPVKPGGLSDRWLADYPNFYGDLSAGSGNGALMRDVGFTKDFLHRHQDKLLYGSDCPCPTGFGPTCLALAKLAFLRDHAASETVRTKILSGNARRIYQRLARA